MMGALRWMSSLIRGALAENSCAAAAAEAAAAELASAILSLAAWNWFTNPFEIRNNMVYYMQPQVYFEYSRSSILVFCR